MGLKEEVRQKHKPEGCEGESQKISGERAFQVKETAKAKSLRQDSA